MNIATVYPLCGDLKKHDSYLLSTGFGCPVCIAMRDHPETTIYDHSIPPCGNKREHNYWVERWGLPHRFCPVCLATKEANKLKEIDPIPKFPSPMQRGDGITIPTEMYNKLIADSRLLECLILRGVGDSSIWDDAVKLFEDTGSINKELKIK